MAGNSSHIKLISDHVEKYIGRITTVFHEIVSDELHIDILHVGSSLFRRYEVIVTCGMSELPMHPPKDSQEPRFAEIVAILPRKWPLSKASFEDERHYWPVRMIKDLARTPQRLKTWLGFGHTVASSASAEDLAPFCEGTELCAAMVLPPMSLGERAFTLTRENAEDIYFWSAVPIYRSELQLAMSQGADALLDRFDAERVSDLIDPLRRPVV